MDALKQKLEQVRAFLTGPRFARITRLHSARDVAEQQGTLNNDHTVAREAADGFYARLRELFEARRSITTFGPYSPGQAVAMKRSGIEGIYLGGWATSAKGSIQEDPGADLASYPLSQVPDEAAPIVRALLTADKNQHFARARMTDAQREAAPVHDFRPFIIADADTGHGGDAHVRNLIRRFAEVGVPGYHIEDQKPGTKKCGHQGGKVLVPVDEQIKRLNAARLQLDIMGVPGIVVARTDAESATFLESCIDERDQPFVLGATRTSVPAYKAGYAAILGQLGQRLPDDVLGHRLFAVGAEELAAAEAWLERSGVGAVVDTEAERFAQGDLLTVDALLNAVIGRYLETWQSEAGLRTYGEAVASALEQGAESGEHYDITVDDWRTFARTASFYEAQAKVAELGIEVTWDAQRPRTPEGYYPIQNGIDFAIAKSLAVAPFADLLWMETKTADLTDAKVFADAIHHVFPDMMLAYNLSPSFNWDTTGMSEDEMRRFPEELGKMGFVFNFITYGGHQIDGLAGEEFATALQEDGMLALARVQRKFRLVESPYKTPQTLVGGPRLDAALMATTGRTASTKAMGKGSTQFQHLVQTEVPVKLLESWLELWTSHYELAAPLRVELRPHTAGSELLELSILNHAATLVANVIFAPIRDRKGQRILSVRDQNTFDPGLRQKRLMTLIHLFMLHRYEPLWVHYVSPTDDNRYQTQKMRKHGLFSEVQEEVGQIIVAKVNQERVAALVAPDQEALTKLIDKTDPPAG